MSYDDTLKAAHAMVPDKRLIIYPSRFVCPHCSRSWDRGGHKEGFVKAAARNHIDACWKARLFLKGFTIVGVDLLPVAEVEPRILRSLKALVRRRRIAGDL